MGTSDRRTQRLARTIGEIWPTPQDIYAAAAELQTHRTLRIGVLDVIVEERVLPQAAYNIGQDPVLSAEFSGLQPTIGQNLADRRRRKSARAQECLNVLRALGLVAAVIKGFAVGLDYPEDQWRDVGDIDLLLPDENDLWAAYGELTGLGYSVKRVRLHPRGGGRFVGIMPARKRLASGLDVEVDVHFGGYPILGSHALAVDGHLHERTISGVRCLVPNARAQLLIAAAHVLHEGHARFRDLNDTRVFRRCLTNEALELVESEANASGLGLVVGGLLADTANGAPPMHALARRLMLARGVHADHIHGEMRLTTSRVLQLSYLASRYRSRGLPSLLALQHAPSLLRWGRPYREWLDREVRPLQDHTAPVVFTPVARFAPLAFERLRAVLADRRQTWTPLGRLAALWNPGADREVLLTPRGAFVQASFSGDIPDDMRGVSLNSARAMVPGAQEPLPWPD